MSFDIEIKYILYIITNTKFYRMKRKINWSVRQGTDEEAKGLAQMSFGSKTLRISPQKKVILITHGHKGTSPYPEKTERNAIIAAVEKQLAS